MIAKLYSFCAIVAAFCLASMMVLTVADAVGRYFFNAPIPGGFEYISYFLAFSILAGYGPVTRDRSHIVVGVISEILPEWYGRIERVVTALATAAGCGFIVWFILKQAMRYSQTGVAGQSSHVPLAPLAYGLTLFAVIAVIFSINQIGRKALERSRVEDEMDPK